MGGCVTSKKCCPAESTQLPKTMPSKRSSPSRHMISVTFNLTDGQPTSTSSLECLGLVLDRGATVIKVVDSSQAAHKDIQPGWNLRWVELERTGCNVNCAVESREDAEEALAFNLFTQKPTLAVVFASANFRTQLVAK